MIINFGCQVSEAVRAFDSAFVYFFIAFHIRFNKNVKRNLCIMKAQNDRTTHQILRKQKILCKLNDE